MYWPQPHLCTDRLHIASKLIHAQTHRLQDVGHSLEYDWHLILMAYEPTIGVTLLCRGHHITHCLGHQMQRSGRASGRHSTLPLVQTTSARCAAPALFTLHHVHLLTGLQQFGHHCALLLHQHHDT